MTDLHDQLMTEAIAEAYSLAPVNDVILQTLEINHSTFSSPVRVVADYGTLQAGTSTDPADPQIYGHMLTLEATAPFNPSTSVLFQSCMFDITKPDMQATSLPQVTITLNNVSFEISQYMDLAVQARTPMSLIYREYLASDLTTPQCVIPGLIVNEVDSNVLRTTMTAGFQNLGAFNFPAVLYRPATHPGLITG